MNPSLKNPLFFWSIQFFIGCGFALYPHWALLFPSLLLMIYRWRDTLFFLVGFCFITLCYPSYHFTEIQGYGDFVLKEIHPTQSPFKRSFALKGYFRTFKSGNTYYHNIPCMFFQNTPPKDGSKWIIEGTLKKQKGNYIFRPHTYLPWRQLPSRFSWARWRFKQKENMRAFFHKKIQNKRVCHFFASIATGDIDDRLLAMEFRKVGLGHILAISGFHFAIITAALGWILKRIFSYEIAFVLLLCTTTVYFFYLGPSPSILRAYSMIFFYILSVLLNRKAQVLNILGAALFIEILYDPYTVTQAGFQLSFLATLGILLFFQPIHKFLHKIFPKRSFIEIKQLTTLDQHGYLAISAIRQACALNISVMLATLPATLYIFHQFPLLSIPYNLIFPPLLGLSLILLPFPFLNFLNVRYTHLLLQMIANPPELLNSKIFTPVFPFPLLVFLITIIFGFGLTKRIQKG